MIELPEAKVLAGQLNENLAGRRVIRVEAGRSSHRFAFFSCDPAEYPKLLEGLTFQHAGAFGGRVEMTLEGMELCFHDGTTPRLYQEQEKIPDKHQLRLDFEDGQTLICTVRMYGGIWAEQAGKSENFYTLIAHEKPDPLGAAFTETYFGSLLEQPNLSAKAFLATEQRIPGLGNGVLQDILFCAGVHPKRKIGTLSDEELTTLYHSVVDTLSAMTGLGGRNTEPNLFGEKGGYRCILSKDTLAYPCPQCGGGLHRAAYLGGNIYFCSQCQREK